MINGVIPGRRVAQGRNRARNPERRASAFSHITTINGATRKHRLNAFAKLKAINAPAALRSCVCVCVCVCVCTRVCEALRERKDATVRVCVRGN